MWKTCVQSLGWEEPLEKGKAAHSGLENSMEYIVYGVAKSQTGVSDFHFSFLQTYERKMKKAIYKYFRKICAQVALKHVKNTHLYS